MKKKQCENKDVVVIEISQSYEEVTILAGNIRPAEKNSQIFSEDEQRKIKRITGKDIGITVKSEFSQTVIRLKPGVVKRKKPEKK